MKPKHVGRSITKYCRTYVAFDGLLSPIFKHSNAMSNPENAELLRMPPVQKVGRLCWCGVHVSWLRALPTIRNSLEDRDVGPVPEICYQSNCFLCVELHSSCGTNGRVSTLRHKELNL